ncbi:MAG: aminomethyl-transferring glycine dehydrogenase subunit GcvPB [candidate division Zixibacteria bacterium]|nr:aminomethyl-transferring glycine dehydrogenase subunit GcvPB [candidate division Zixibacteria bacterium]MBU1470752.1 aminomethyl-transferring glycine dehydrogenase subunit GcvPB [candidate division Zixibacteria bacterium]MBU2624488.1 aminomethyl-transferring glycine dehydrogenase subunit GcvPB [candidate division Zixibacteria bacterium]
MGRRADSEDQRREELKTNVYSTDGRNIFEKSHPGRKGYTLPAVDVETQPLDILIDKRFLRDSAPNLPEVSENEIMRHFVGMSVKNHHIDKGFYPLGSCTMKYNPKVNERTARYPGFASVHPLQLNHTVAGALELLHATASYLAEIAGMHAVTLQPAAGAQGEFCGMLIARKYHIKNGNKRKYVVLPDSAHGTNPASVVLAGYQVKQVKSSEDGTLSPQALAEVVDEDTAAVMLTNPNTLGLFEKSVEEIAKIVHDAGALLYMDGANLNAQLGIVRPGDLGFDIVHFNLHKTFSTPHGGGGPGSGPVGVTEKLEPFLPYPVVSKKSDDGAGKYYLNYNRPDSIGKLHAFYGNFGVIVRACTYILSNGAEGLREVAESAIVNANYLKEQLKEKYDLPHPQHCMHEFVLSGNRQKKRGVRTADIAKRLLDFGVHAPTCYFPLIVPEAIMIEPTDTETREVLDRFAEIMLQIDREVDEDPEMLRTAPHNTPVGRLDERKAATELDVVWEY